MNRYFFYILLLNCSFGFGQYTETINSNRPSTSIGAFGVGKNVYQIEQGFTSENGTFDSFNQSQYEGFGFQTSLRVGFLKEQLELMVNIDAQMDQFSQQTERGKLTKDRTGLLKSTIGIKYLFFDPFRNPEWYKPNLYSWKKNQGLKWIHLVPAVSFFVGTEFSFDDTYPYGERFNPLFNTGPFVLNPSFFSGQGVLITQQHFSGHSVLVGNFGVRYFGTRYETNFATLTFTCNLNSRWSIFAEYKGLKNELNSDVYLQIGSTYLLNKNTQIDISTGKSVKNTPSIGFMGLGISYRLDRHKDIEPQNRKKLKEIKIVEKKLNSVNSNDKKSSRRDQKQNKKLVKKQNKIERKLRRLND